MIDLTAKNAALEPGRIVLEVAPALGVPHPSLDNIDDVRALGFRVSLADSGLSEGGLGLLLELKPDYIRLWGDVVRCSSSDFFRRAILDSFSQLAWKFGALLIASGADEAGDRATLLEAGVALMKGRLAGSAIRWDGLANASGGALCSPLSTKMNTEQSFEDRSGRKYG
jgi:EAL domain-containing protein (putative c-di-GMP-specific phosphodiesterase class I)